MMALVCVGALVWHSSQGEATANADYIRAGIFLANAAVDLRPPVDGDLLAWAEKSLEKYGKAIEWVVAGNKKPILPIDSLKPVYRTPEAASAVEVGRLFEAQIFKQIADGSPNRAATALVDGLTFARNVQSLNASSYEIGSIVIQRLLIMFDLNRRAFAEKGLEEISKAADRLLTSPAERLAISAEIAAHKNPEYFPKQDNPEYAHVVRRIAEIENKWKAIFDSEEKNWSSGPADNTEYLIDLEIGLQYYPKLAIVTRTKLRLLKATTEILLHDIRQYKLPDIYDAVYDPAVGEPLFYGKRDDAFVIYSKGTKETGKIELGSFWEDK
jgi:hypothetical protein